VDGRKKLQQGPLAFLFRKALQSQDINDEAWINLKDCDVWFAVLNYNQYASKEELDFIRSEASKNNVRLIEMEMMDEHKIKNTIDELTQSMRQQ
jgi:hypothetical protein